MRKSSIGQLIRRARENADLTQEELGKRIGFKASQRQRVSDLESGRKGDPQLSTLKKIAKACGLKDVAALLKGLRSVVV